jgi:hypothetical protein
MNSFISTLPGVFEAIETSDKVGEAFIFAAWRRVAGEQVVERTAPLLVEEKRLVIAVADRTWKRNLETLASQLLFKLNASLGKPSVDFIEFRIAPESVNRVGSEESDSGSVQPAPPEISVSARTIRDEGLRNAVLKAATNCLSRQK